jgi:uncharacterized protein (DUF1015 family)
MNERVFIEEQFPVSKVSKESYKERKKGRFKPDVDRSWQVVGTKTVNFDQSIYYRDAHACI